MLCSGCGNDHAVAVHIVYDKDGKHEFCDACGKVSSVYVPDVAVPAGGYFDENLGSFITSRRQKAALMKEKGLVEAGNRVNRTLGKPMPYIADIEKRKKFLRDNFGE